MSSPWPNEKMVQRYLADDLTETELDEMECDLLSNPEFLRHVEAESALRSGLRATGLDYSDANQHSTVSFWARIQSLVATPTWSWAASGVACIALAVAVLPTRSPDPDAGHSNDALYDRIVYIGPTRSSDTTPAKTINAEETVIIAIDAIDWKAPTSAAMIVRLTGQDTDISFQPQNVNADFQLVVPVPPLHPGEYKLSVSAEGMEPKHYTIVSR